LLGLVIPQIALAGAISAVGAIVVGVLADKRALARWTDTTNAHGDTRVASEWPTERARLASNYAAALQAFCERAATAQADWDEAEAARVEWATALFNGDLATIEQAVFDSLDEIDFPFESDCTIAASDPTSIFVNLDAPEIEDVVPETRLKVLKAGVLKEVNRKAEERNAVYLQLVCGIVLAVAATVFSAAPTVESIAIAAFTQRRRRGATAIEDQYVLESRIERDAFAALNVSGSQPADSLSRLQTRCDVGANFTLKAIPAPPWVAEFWKDTATDAQ